MGVEYYQTSEPQKSEFFMSKLLSFLNDKKVIKTLDKKTETPLKNSRRKTAAQFLINLNKLKSQDSKLDDRISEISTINIMNNSNNPYRVSNISHFQPEFINESKNLQKNELNIQKQNFIDKLNKKRELLVKKQK